VPVEYQHAVVLFVGDGRVVLLPAGALAVTGGAVAVRVRRLLSPAAPLPAAARWAALGCAVGLLLVPTALLVLPALA
jgi:hypothetical protein